MVLLVEEPGSTFTINSLSPSDEKENNHFEGLAAARRKISPPVNGSGSGSGSPVRPGRRGESERSDNGGANGGDGRLDHRVRRRTGKGRLR